jgi:hypothetical protein
MGGTTSTPKQCCLILISGNITVLEHVTLEQKKKTMEQELGSEGNSYPIGTNQKRLHTLSLLANAEASCNLATKF